MTTNNNEKMQSLTVEEKLQNLYELQKIDSEIDKIRTIRGELPFEVQDLEAELIGLGTRVENLKKDIASANEEISIRTRGIEVATAKKQQSEEKINNVSNSREFDSLNKEIDYQGREIELHQKKIRDIQRNLADKESALANAEQTKNERQAELESKKNELDSIIAEYHQKEEELCAKSNQLSTKIEERLLTAYNKIRHGARNGLAVVTVDRNACGGCFNNIPPQRQLDICSHKKVIVCEYCGRILVDKYICDYDGSLRKADMEAMESNKRKSRRTKKTEE